MEYILITPAINEPLTLDEVKQKLRLVGNNDFDTELTRLIATSREMCESITGRDLTIKTYKTFLDCFKEKLEIEKSKLQSIVAVRYWLNNSLTLLPSTEYYITNANDYAKIIFKSAIQHDEREQAIEIEFTAGYITIPSALKDAMLNYIDFLFNAGCSSDNKVASQLFASFIIAKKMFFTI